MAEMPKSLPFAGAPREVGTCNVQISELPSQQQPVLFAGYETRERLSMSTSLLDFLIVYEERRPNSR